MSGRVTASGRVPVSGRTTLRESQNILQTNRTLTGGNWSLVAATRTGSQTDPFGGTQAVLITEDNTTNVHGLYSSGTTITGSANRWYCASVFMKAGATNFAGLFIDGSASFQCTALWDLTTGSNTLLSTTALAGSARAASESFGNGWWRYTFAFFVTSPLPSAGLGFFWRMCTASNGTTFFYLGNSTRSAYVFAPAWCWANWAGQITDTTSGILSNQIRNLALGRTT